VVPNDSTKLARICGMEREEFSQVWETVKLRFVYAESKNHMVQCRLAEQREKAILLWCTRRNNGKRGGRPPGGESANNGKNKEPHGSVLLNLNGNLNGTMLEDGGRRKEEVKEKKDECVEFGVDESLEVEIPSSLDIDSFREAWREWIEYKQGSKHAWKAPQGIKAQLTRLTRYDTEQVVCGIYNSISRGWQGIVVDDAVRGKSNGQSNQHDPRGNLALLERMTGCTHDE